MIELDINNPFSIVELFKPKKFSIKWFWRSIKAWWRNSLLVRTFQFVGICFFYIKTKFLLFSQSILRTIIALSNGVEVIRVLLSVAFLYFIDRTLWEEIKESQLSRQALGVGILTSMGWFFYSMQSHHFSIYAIVFLSYQILRMLVFLGMERKSIKEEEAKTEATIKSTVKSIEQLIEEKEEREEEGWG